MLMFDLWETFNELKAARIKYGNAVTLLRRTIGQGNSYEDRVALADLKIEKYQKKLQITDRKLANLFERFSFIEHAPDLLFDMVSGLSSGYGSFIQSGDYLGIINEKLHLEDSKIEEIYLFKAGKVHVYGSRMKIDVAGSEFTNKTLLLQDPGDWATVDILERPDQFLIREHNDPVRMNNGIMVYYDKVDLPKPGETKYTQRVFAASEGLMRAARALKTPVRD
tara:strand:+ start:241 stop:909 length:669 start_codon:yes stop_codon:yes gene_type:complete